VYLVIFAGKNEGKSESESAGCKMVKVFSMRVQLKT
jgi:hypothetical protein